MNLGGVRPMRCKGQVVLEVNDVGENDYTGRFLCSVFGWVYKSYSVGQGSTFEGAVRDWCEQTGNDYAAVVAGCRFLSHRGEIPDGFLRPLWGER
jgi:hypothetical protein